MHGQTHCLFFSLPASPSKSLSLLFFSGWPCADSPAVLFLTSTHDCSEETVKSTCTLPCRDLPALCAGPGDAGIVQSDLSYKSVSTLVHDYCLVTGQSALLKVVDWFVNRRLKQTWTQRNNLGLVFFLYISTYFLKWKAHVYSNAWIHVPNKHRCCTHIQNNNRDDLSRVVKYSRSCAHSFISELPLTYVATCSSHTSALIKSLRQIGSLFPASQIQTNKKSDKLSLLYFRAH